MEKTDVVISYQALCTMLAFADGTLSEDMRAKGLHTRRGSEPERVDLFRVGRLPDAPNAIIHWHRLELGSLRTPPLAAPTSTSVSYDVNFQYVVTGEETVDGPPSIREVTSMC